MNYFMGFLVVFFSLNKFKKPLFHAVLWRNSLIYSIMIIIDNYSIYY